MAAIFIHDLIPAVLSTVLPDTSGFSVIDANKKVACCQGCFRCWLASPGQCVMKDDLQTVGAQIGSCEKLIILSRCCYGEFSPGVKRVLDRAISLSLPFFTYRGGRVHHPLRYQNRPTLTVCFYGAVTDFERETTAKLVEVNRVNMGFSAAQAFFAEKPEFLTEMIKPDEHPDFECQSKIQGQHFCILFIPVAAVSDRV